MGFGSNKKYRSPHSPPPTMLENCTRLRSKEQFAPDVSNREILFPVWRKLATPRPPMGESEKGGGMTSFAIHLSRGVWTREGRRGGESSLVIYHRPCSTNVDLISKEKNPSQITKSDNFCLTPISAPKKKQLISIGFAYGLWAPILWRKRAGGRWILFPISLD